MTVDHVDEVAAMGTNAKVITVGGDAELQAHLLFRLEALEAAWSRFRDDSEVATMNRRAGEFVHVSRETFELVEKAVCANELTAGAFDALLLEPLEQLGYDRTFEDLDVRSHRTPEEWEPAGAGIDIDHSEQAVRLPAGFGFDPGGIGKGLAADLLATEAIEHGASGALVSIGGDLRVIGAPLVGSSWGIRLAEPAIGHPLDEVLGLTSGAVATSTTKKRIWGPGRHHLLDPATGRPHAEVPDGSNPVLVTVVAGEAWYADAMTKACFARPSVQPAATSGLVITEAGHRCTFGAFEALCGRQAVPV